MLESHCDVFCVALCKVFPTGMSSPLFICPFLFFLPFSPHFPSLFCTIASGYLRKKDLSLFIIFNSSVLLYPQCHFLLSILILIRIEKGNSRHFTNDNLLAMYYEFLVLSVALVPLLSDSILFFVQWFCIAMICPAIIYTSIFSMPELQMILSEIPAFYYYSQQSVRIDFIQISNFSTFNFST